MDFNDKKTSMMKLVDLLKTHDLLMAKCPEVIEVIENLYYDIEKMQIEEAFNKGKEMSDNYVVVNGETFYLTAMKYYNQTYKR